LKSRSTLRMSNNYYMDTITVLIVDDHKLIRDAWASYLSIDRRFTVVGETGNGEEALSIAKDKHPDVALVDINMKPMDGFELTRQLRLLSPSIQVIGVSMHMIPDYARKMLKAGASGYVTKSSKQDELAEAILTAHQGKKFICREIRDLLADELSGNTRASQKAKTLTKTELAVATLIKEGYSSREIAKEMNRALKTVEVHRYNILKKLDLPNTAALVNFLNEQRL
jgi:two-component system invasion response regulator UvrY